MKTIDIISHCYALEMKQYAHALHYQLSSLVLWKPAACNVTMTVCLYCDDRAVERTIMAFRDKLCIHELHLSVERLGRRAIGRNLAAKSTEADIVWFADVDMAFRGGVLDRLAGLLWPAAATMIFPKWIKIHRNHAMGGKALEKARCATDPIDVDESEFKDKQYKRAIGGVQIVQGDFARQHGYVPDTKWQKEVKKPFGDFRGDVAYRKQCLEYGPIVAVELPGVYRLRHPQTSYQ